eukprot:TRINITY_DN21310_c0_g1_i2.p2 TRINITY_DN21310_c0_g1~~TRINITY_DN21310_c0_g1_i2.p2  ORF type:complete len:123 (-),score=17.64 TRINITY_DN21310_c0_g1_i2:114-482(-)
MDVRGTGVIGTALRWDGTNGGCGGTAFRWRGGGGCGTIFWFCGGSTMKGGGESAAAVVGGGIPMPPSCGLEVPFGSDSDHSIGFLASIAMMAGAVSYTHLRAHETPEHLVCRLLLEKKKKTI